MGLIQISGTQKRDLNETFPRDRARPQMVHLDTGFLVGQKLGHWDLIKISDF